MTEQIKGFVATGFRRVLVALVAILSIAGMEVFTESGVGWPAVAGIGIVTLGFYTTKFVEALPQIADTLKSFFTRK